MAKGQVRRIDTGYFNDAIRELNGALATFKEAIRTIDAQTKTMQASWDGKGADKFDSAYKRLKQEFDDQSETLTALRDDLKVMLETYQKWDEEAKNSIAGNEMSN